MAENNLSLLKSLLRFFQPFSLLSTRKKNKKKISIYLLSKISGFQKEIPKAFLHMAENRTIFSLTEREKKARHCCPQLETTPQLRKCCSSFEILFPTGEAVHT